MSTLIQTTKSANPSYVIRRLLTLLANIEAVKQEKKIMQDKMALPRMTFQHQLNSRAKDATHEVRSLSPSGTCRRHGIVQARCKQSSQPDNGSIEKCGPVPNPLFNRKLCFRHFVGKSRNNHKIVLASLIQVRCATLTEGWSELRADRNTPSASIWRHYHSLPGQRTHPLAPEACIEHSQCFLGT